ncbi:hypothetical protein ASF28_19455 [Methylobacterium sp. Leaf99]|nr:hypothetical protein ASF28_19455 [Methylobacterium sp. Leaf99]
MGHQPEHVELFGVDARDGVERAVAVGVDGQCARRVAVAERHAAIAFEARDGVGVREVVALAVRHADVDDLLLGVGGGESGVGPLDPQELPVADEAAVDVAHEHAGQQAGFAQDLEAVADAEHEAAAGRVCPHRIHGRRAPGDGAAAEIVAIGEAARQDGEVGARRQLGVGVPDLDHLGPGLGERPGHVRVAVRTREDDDGGAHQAISIA